jgi:peptidoglycan-associated lipoprotein
MAGASTSARLALGSLAIVLALSGCAGRSWQFWKSSSSTPAPRAEERWIAPTSPGVPTAHSVAAPTATAAAAPSATAEKPAAATPAAKDYAEQASLGSVFFLPGIMVVGKADVRTLDGVARWLTDNPRAQVRIEGHTDDLGDPKENRAIGHMRAESAAKYLVGKGVQPERISIVSFGSERPTCGQKTPECRAKNRRVHFVVSQ